MKIFVTAGAGFIGSNLIQYVLECRMGERFLFRTLCRAYTRQKVSEWATSV